MTPNSGKSLFLKALSDILLSLALISAAVAAIAFNVDAPSTGLLALIFWAFTLLAGYSVRP